MTYVTRFAPSPTGRLHLGHAYSAMTAFNRAKARSGTFLLRVEDIDQARSRSEWECQIFDDLRWLGLHWPEPVMRQSERLPSYRDALARLIEMGICYPCRCSRRDIRAALTAPQEGSPMVNGLDGPIYPGTCRGRSIADSGTNDAIRLNAAAALDLLDRSATMTSRIQIDGGTFVSSRNSDAIAEAGPLAFTESGPLRSGNHQITREAVLTRIGDIVVARKDIGTSYHLAVVVDDAKQGISEVVRGEDLFDATFVQVLLQDLLALPRPTYFHHRLIRDESGRRLAKRDDARSLSRYRSDGLTPQHVVHTTAQR